MFTPKTITKFCFSLCQDLVALSLLGNKLNSSEVVVQEVIKFKHLKGIWLNDNPVLKNW